MGRTSADHRHLMLLCQNGIYVPHLEDFIRAHCTCSILRAKTIMPYVVYALLILSIAYLE